MSDHTSGPGPIGISRRTALIGLGGLAVVGVGGYWLTDGMHRGEGRRTQHR